MSDTREREAHDGDDEAITTRLLRLAGERPAVTTARAERVRAAVQAEWQRTTRRRRGARRAVWTAAGLAAAAVLVALIRPWDGVRPSSAPTPGEAVAHVERVEGAPRRSSESAASPAGAPLERGEPVRIGEWIATDEAARVAMRFSDGTIVRLDVGSRARPLDPRTIELAAGAAYVDTGSETGRFEVRTRFATARDIGTQFEVRLLHDAVRVRVRSGLVELSTRSRTLTARRGTEVRVSASEAISRPFAPHDQEWGWTLQLAPPLTFEGVTLAAFLARAAREHGWSLRYADAGLALEAERIVLHGSAQGLSAREALEVAVASSGLQHRLEEGELTVSRGPKGR